MVIHPQSFRALAYEVLDHLTASGATDDTKLNLPLIEQELRHQTGIYLKENDRLTERMGMDPESYRVESMNLSIAGDALIREIELAGLLTFNGKPYTQFVGIMGETHQLGFVPCDYKWQLASMVKLTNQPCFTLNSNTITIRLTPTTIGIDDILLIGIPADPFPKENRSDTWYWKQAWFLSEEGKVKIKMQTLRVFMGTHIQLRPLVDNKNNGTEQ